MIMSLSMASSWILHKQTAKSYIASISRLVIREILDRWSDKSNNDLPSSYSYGSLCRQAKIYRKPPRHSHLLLV